MPTPAPLNPNSTPAASDEPAVVLGLEHHLHKFWEKNARSVYAFCAVVLLVIVGKGVYEFYEGWQDKKLGTEYAAASTSEKLKAFASAHPKHPLGGAARLRLADEAFSNNNYAQAALDYQAAADVLKESAFVGRARLGSAISKLQGGQSSDGEAQLKLLASDSSQLKTIRAEAAYQLASAAAAAGRTDDALKFLDQVTTLAPTGTWAQRSMMLRVTLPTPAVSAAQPAATIPAIKLPAKP
jgi:hypothetical protein